MSSDWRAIPPRDNIPGYRVFTKPIEKPSLDDREYRLLNLDNGLRAMMVSDPTADKAAASLDVAVGHLWDPDDMPGLAHFLEHMLFLGTERFPRENEYKEYLSKHNGRSNASTSSSNTTYYFGVDTPFLKGALERFSAFFHCPLFSPSCTARELHAVDSEFKKNLQSDSRRLFQLGKHLSKPGSVWRKFGTGNLTSLARGTGTRDDEQAIALDGCEGSDGGSVGTETRRRVIEWWEKEYCSSRMRLCVVRKESLEELSELIATLFTPIPNRQRDPLPMITEHPLTANEMGRLVRVQNIRTFQSLEVHFPLDYQQQYWRHKPGSYIAHFLGHEGPGSLHSYLTSKGWIISLSAYSTGGAPRGTGMFEVDVTLTIDGFKNHREILKTLFKYINLLKTSNLEYYHQSERVTTSHTSFRFREKSAPESFVQSVSRNMSHPAPSELVLGAPTVVWDWDVDPSPGKSGAEDKVREYLESFTPERCRVFLTGKKDEHEGCVKGEMRWLEEPWYGTGYMVEEFDEELIDELSNHKGIDGLHLPKPNDFIPRNFDVGPTSEEPLKRPFMIYKSPMSVVWHKRDDQFRVPKGKVSVFLLSPTANASPKASLMDSLYSRLVKDTLDEYSYDASLAGLRYSVSATSTGMEISVSGYNDKIELLLDRVLETVKDAKVDEERLKVQKEKVHRSWNNFYLGQPYSLSRYNVRYIMNQRQWTYDEELEVLDAITCSDVENHIKELLGQVKLRMLVAGNINRAKALDIAKLAESRLGVAKEPSLNLQSNANLLPKGCNLVYTLLARNPKEVNSALSYYLHFGPLTDQRLRVTASLLVRILAEPAFTTLRTKEQLGYIVFCSTMVLSGAGAKGVKIEIQSERDPAYLEERVEAFLRGMEERIRSMEEDVFSEYKVGLARKWTEKEKNVWEEIGRLETWVANGQWDFMRSENDVPILDEITKQEVMDLFLSHICPSSTTSLAFQR